MKAPTGTQHKPQSLTSAATPSPMCNVYRCLQRLLHACCSTMCNILQTRVAPVCLSVYTFHAFMRCLKVYKVSPHLTGAPSKPELTEHTLLNFLTNVSFNLRVTMISPLSSVCSWKQPPKPHSCRTKSGEKGHGALVMPLLCPCLYTRTPAMQQLLDPPPKRFSRNCFILAISIFPMHTQEREMLCRCWK